MTELEKKIIALFEDEWHVEEDYAHFEVIEDGDWEVDRKYQFRSSIVKFMDKHYRINEARRGSCWDDYEYDAPDIFEVIHIEKITFAEGNSGYGCSIAKNSYGDVTLFDYEEDWTSAIATKQDAENLIKALQKAIELGWFN